MIGLKRYRSLLENYCELQEKNRRKNQSYRSPLEEARDMEQLLEWVALGLNLKWTLRSKKILKKLVAPPGTAETGWFPLMIGEPHVVLTGVAKSLLPWLLLSPGRIHFTFARSFC